MRVSINVLSRNGNAVRTCRPFAQGVERCGDKVKLRTENDYQMDDFDIAILWGFLVPCQTIIKSCRDSGKPFIFIDLGYWRRDHHYVKVTVNDRHPTAYLMKQPMPATRFNKLKLTIKPWRGSTNGYILLAGMSGKAAWSWNLVAESYEREAVAELRKHTQRSVVYRPKPNWQEAQPIDGTKLDKRTQLEVALREASCVVTHHSNIGCDAVLEGIPVLSKCGAVSALVPYDLKHLEKLECPVDREQWCYNLAYCQWTLNELADGSCWNHFKTMGMLHT